METLALSIRAPLRRDDLPGLYARVCGLLEEHAPRCVLCDVSGLPPDAVALDALARLRLAALRRGCRVELAGASGELRALVSFAGLEGVV